MMAKRVDAEERLLFHWLLSLSEIQLALAWLTC